eukprot:730163-Pyramimonas_sp.AAC.1
MAPRLVRQTCRARALARASAVRSDAAGAGQIDFEASLAKMQSTFRGALKPDDKIHREAFRSAGGGRGPTRPI